MQEAFDNDQLIHEELRFTTGKNDVQRRWKRSKPAHYQRAHSLVGAQQSFQVHPRRVPYSPELFRYQMSFTCVQAEDLIEYQIEEVIRLNSLLQKNFPSLVNWIEYLLAWLEVVVETLLHSGRAEQPSSVLWPL